MPEDLFESFEYSCNYLSSAMESVSIVGSKDSILGEHAFTNNIYLNEVQIESIRRIDNYAFEGCIELREFILPRGLESVGSNIFNGCTRLSKLYIGTSLIETTFDFMSTYFDYLQSQIRDVTILSGVTNIGDAAFSDCIQLTSVELPNSLESIGNSGFQNCERRSE